MKPLIQYPGEQMHVVCIESLLSSLVYKFLPVSLRVRFAESAVEQAFFSAVQTLQSRSDSLKKSRASSDRQARFPLCRGCGKSRA